MREDEITVLLPLDPEASTVIRIIWLGYAWKLWVFGGSNWFGSGGWGGYTLGVDKEQAGIGKPGHFPHGKPSVPHMVCGPRDKQGRMCVQAWAGLFTAGLLASLSSSNQKTEESCMANIEANKGVVTQINVFTVAPENQQALIELLIESAKSVCELPGWMSASIHRSADGTRVVNYAQAENMEAQDRIVASLRTNGFLERNKKLAEAHPGLYEVVYTLTR